LIIRLKELLILNNSKCLQNSLPGFFGGFAGDLPLFTLFKQCCLLLGLDGRFPCESF